MSEFVMRKHESDAGIVFGVMEEIIRCENCKHYQGECCVRFGRQEHPHREPNDFCSKGEPKNDREL